MTEQEMYIQRLKAAHKICVQAAEKASRSTEKRINLEQANYLQGRIDEALKGDKQPAIVFTAQTPDYDAGSNT